MAMTRQEMLDKAWAGLKAQGCQGEDAQGTCRYAQISVKPDGSRHEIRCAVGHLFPGDIPAAIMLNNYSAKSWEVCDALGLQRGEGLFLGDLQAAHDCAEDMQNMAARFHRLAKQWNLTFTE